MADHKKAIHQLLIDQGLFSHTVNDMIYINISRKNFPNWKGWDLIDLKLEKLNLDSTVINNWKTIGKYLKTSGVLNDYICELYKEKLWDQILGDKIISQEFSSIIFQSVIEQGLISTNKLLNQMFIHMTSQEDLINNINNYYLINSGYLFVINFLKLKIKRYLRILNRYPNYINKIILLINDAFQQVNEVLDLTALERSIDIKDIFIVQQFIENKNIDIDELQQLLNNF